MGWVEGKKEGLLSITGVVLKLRGEVSLASTLQAALGALDSEVPGAGLG